MGVEIFELAKLPKHEQAIYINTIAIWAQEMGSKYHPERRKLEDWKIAEPQLDTIPITFVALDNMGINRKIVGVVILNCNDLEGALLENAYRLSTLYVDKEYRRQGISLKLINALMCKVEQRQVKDVWLYTHEQQDFYIKLGWEFQMKRQCYAAEACLLKGDIGKILKILEAKIAALASSGQPLPEQSASVSLKL